LIVLGDKTSHGGAVLEASQHSDSGGIGLARVGDKVSCPIHGDTAMIVDGKPVARHGDTVGCGATLIAGQQATVDQI
jgi:uncharacterized Zn-binding protein involved in type VI secretion